ncbi:MAG: type II toxin-antitoxin system Phd/YefM family antitoxin [Salinivirgaceae bacterium]|nr:type II toxin-antitoxin system Phd/YefM family antitoxin [Salinivirgaceae bacterium]
MKVVSSREFRDNQKKYFDMVDNKEQIIVKRKNRAYKLVPVSDDDMLVEIPQEFRIDPYEVSPSGDMFWADKRNVEIVKKAIENKDQIAEKLNSTDALKNFLNTL